MSRLLTILNDSLATLSRRVSEASPTALVVGGLLLAGWITARLVGALVRRLVARVQRSLPAAPGDARVDIRSQRGARMLATVARWLVMAVFIMIAAETAGLGAVASWVAELATYLPRILVALVIVGGGVVLAGLARRTVARAVSAAGLPRSEAAGRAVQIVMVGAVGLVAIDHLGVEIGLLVTIAEIIAAALFGSAALAFGLGARTTVENVLASHYVRKSYELGQRVRLDGAEGQIIHLGPTSVVLEGAEGETTIPAREFALRRCVLLGSEAPR